MNARFTFLFLSLILLSLPLYCQESYIYGKQILEISQDLSPLFPRDENSDNEKLLFQYLEKQFTANNIDFETMDYSESETGHSFSRGYKARIEGDIDDTVIFAVPLNNKENQTQLENGTVNIASAIQLLRIFSRYRPPVSIEFLFLGAERGRESGYPMGSQLFLRDFTITSPTIALYLDIEAPGDRIVLRNSSESDQSPLWLLKKLARQLTDNQLIFTTDSIESLALQSGFEEAPAILQTYLNSDVPTILLESDKVESSPIPDDQWLNSFIESILAFILDNSGGFPEDWDRHYLAGESQGKLLVLGEKEGLLASICIIAALLLTLLFKSRNLHLNLKRFRSHLWTFPLLVLLIFLYLFLSTLIIEDISGLRDYPDFWEQAPLLFLLFKLFMAMFLYSAFIYLIRGISLSPSHHFYTYAAFVSVIISMITVMFYNINFFYFFLWSLLGVTLFMISRKKIVKRTAIFLTPLPLIIIGYRVFTEPFYEICRFLLTSRISGNIFFTIIAMPTLMLFSSLTHYIHRFHRHRRSFRSLFSIAVWALLASLSLYFILTLDSFGPDDLQPIYINEQIDLEENSRSISISSPAPIGDLELKLDDNQMNLKNIGRKAQITAPMISDLIQISKDSSSFLDRMSLLYHIDAVGNPDKILIEMISDQSMIIFDSNFPSEMSADGKTVAFLIGSNPDMPLDLAVILPKSLRPTMNIRLEYSDFPYDFHLPDRALSVNKMMSVTSRLYWEK